MAKLTSTQIPATALPRAGSSMAPSLGSAFGSGLGQGLQFLLQDKINKMQESKTRTQQASGLGTLLGLSPEKALQLTYLPPQTLNEIIKQKMLVDVNGNYPNEQQPSQFGNAEMNQAAPPSASPPQENNQQLSEAMRALGMFDYNPMDQAVRRYLQSKQPADAPMTQPTMGTDRPAIPEQSINAPVKPEMARDIGRPMTVGQARAAREEARIARQEALVEKKMAQQERLAEKKSEQEDKKFSFTETRKYRDQVNTNSKNARSDLQNLRMQKDLIKTGKLMGPKETAFLDIVGSYFNLDENGKSAFKNAQTQVFEKLSVPYFRGLKEKFGARPTQWDAQQLQKSFPSLYQTDAGKEVIIEFMEHDSMSNIKEKKISDEIIRRNNGIPPIDLASQVEDRLSTWKDKEYLKLRKNVSRILAKESGPNFSAEKAGKDAMLESDDGIVFRSNGKEWELVFSDTQGM